MNRCAVQTQTGTDAVGQPCTHTLTHLFTQSHTPHVQVNMRHACWTTRALHLWIHERSSVKTVSLINIYLIFAFIILKDVHIIAFFFWAHTLSCVFSIHLFLRKALQMGQSILNLVLLLTEPRLYEAGSPAKVIQSAVTHSSLSSSLSTSLPWLPPETIKMTFTPYRLFQLRDQHGLRWVTSTAVMKQRWRRVVWWHRKKRRTKESWRASAKGRMMR